VFVNRAILGRIAYYYMYRIMCRSRHCSCSPTGSRVDYNYTQNNMLFDDTDLRRKVYYIIYTHIPIEY